MEQMTQLSDGPVTAPPDATVLLATAVTDPNAAQAPVSDPNAGAILTRAEAKTMVDEAVTQLSTQHTAALEASEKRAKVHHAAVYIEGLIAARPGDAPADLRLNTELSSMRASLHAGDSDKEPKWFIDRANELSKTRFDEIQASGGDGAEHLPRVSSTGGSRLFAFDELCVKLSEQITEHGDRFELSALPDDDQELSVIKELPTKHPWVGETAARLSENLGPRGRVIPFPLASLGFGPEMAARRVQLADTYGADGANIREHTFRRDMLVEYFRPDPVLSWLGAPMPMISNDQHLPRLSASLQGDWYAENADIADEGLTFAPLRTSPKRFGVRDDLSWMLLAAADAQLGIQPIITMEVGRAVGQSKESATFAGASAGNNPVGINATAGINSVAITSDTPTFKSMLDLEVDIAEEHIPTEAIRGVITPAIRRDLAMTLRFAVANQPGGQHNIPLWVPMDAGGDGMPGTLRLRVGEVASSFPAVQSTNLPTDLTGNNDEHLMLAGVWSYVVCFDYSVAFLTIDDISQAIAGRTRITVNSYHDVAVRLAKAFSKAQWNPNA